MLIDDLCKKKADILSFLIKNSQKLKNFVFFKLKFFAILTFITMANVFFNKTLHIGLIVIILQSFINIFNP